MAEVKYAAEIQSYNIWKSVSIKVPTRKLREKYVGRNVSKQD